MFLCPLLSDGKELVLVVAVHLSCRCTHSLEVFRTYCDRVRTWFDVDDEHGIVHFIIKMGMHIVGTLLPQVVNYLVVHIHLEFIS